MKIFNDKAEKEDSKRAQQMIAEVGEKLANERAFWDNVIFFAEPENETEAARVVAVADKLLELRRQRFPL
jgi:hypothetical protein